MKRCTVCREELPFAEFQRDRSKPDGLASPCKRCRADGKLRSTYGITLADYEGTLARQGNRCAICKTTEPGGAKHMSRWAVDHDHVTGLVRGVLCHSCNLALGKFKDSPALLRQALAYLEAA